MTSVAAEFEHMEIQQQYNDGVNNRWDADDWDNENSSARLFERSRIKALAGKKTCDWTDDVHARVSFCSESDGPGELTGGLPVIQDLLF